MKFIKVSQITPLLFLSIILSSINLSFSQTDFERKIDTTTLKIAPRFYVTNLNIKPLDNGEEIELSWKAYDNVRYFMVEIHDEESDELIYRQKHNHNRLIFPKEGIFSVAPLTKHRQGINLSISLEEARNRNFEPKNTARYYELEEGKRKTKLLRKREAVERKANEKKLQDEKDKVSTIIGVGVFVLTTFLAMVIVLIIWLVNRKKSLPVKTTYNSQFDDDFEIK